MDEEWCPKLRRPDRIEAAELRRRPAVASWLSASQADQVQTQLKRAGRSKPKELGQGGAKVRVRDGERVRLTYRGPAA